ncbi:MAG: hypothetical protein ABIH34_06635 [Nanoarchaeota archaeon]
MEAEQSNIGYVFPAAAMLNTDESFRLAIDKAFPETGKLEEWLKSEPDMGGHLTRAEIDTCGTSTLRYVCTTDETNPDELIKRLIDAGVFPKAPGSTPVAQSGDPYRLRYWDTDKKYIILLEVEPRKS